ncbi:MAG: PAS domain S-box protein [Phycisphaerae bacterium]|nr:PAS domain S-box protein [Phycisphaerae bacterium]
MNPYTLLIIEDDNDLAVMLQKLLKEHGYHLDRASNGAQAIDFLATQRPDLMLVDYTLPDMTGFELLKKLPDKETLPPYIIVTGHNNTRLAVEALKDGALDYIVKDESFIDLLPAIISRCFKQIEQQKALRQTQESLREAYADLERRVQERTRELTDTNELLRREIVQRQQSDDNLIESEEKFRMLTEQSLMDILIIQDGQIKYTNQAFCDIFEWTAEGFLALPPYGFASLIHPDDKELALERLKRQQGGASNDIRDYTIRCYTQTGQLIYIDIYSKTIQYHGQSANMVTCANATERKFTEEQLRQNETRFRNVLESSRDLIYKLNLTTGFYDFISNSVKDQTGFTTEEFLAMSAEEAFNRFHPEDRLHYQEHLDSLLNHTIEQDIKPTIEYRWKCKDNQYRWFSDNRVLIRDDQNNPIAIIGSARDVTKNKQAEELLRQNETTFRSVLESTRDLIYKYNLTTASFEFLSPAIEQAFGYTQDEYIRLTAKEIIHRIHPEDRAHYTEHFTTLLNDSQFENAKPISEYRWKRKEGDYRWFSNSRVVLRDPQGKPISVIGALRDITEHKLIEEQLRQTEQQWRSLLTNSPDTIMLLDQKGRIQYINRVRKELKTIDVLGDTIYEHLAEEQHNIHRKMLDQAFQTGQVVSRNVIGPENCWYAVRIVPLSKDDKINTVMLIATDINEQIQSEKLLKANEEQLNIYHDQMIQAERIAQLGTLSATIAHELNQPLTVIRLLLQNSLMELNDSKKIEVIQENLDDSLDEINQMVAISNRYRNLMRIPEREQTHPFSLLKTARRVIDSLHKSAEQANISVVTEGLETLPPLQGEPGDFEQIFFILTQNAIQASMDKANRRLKITGRTQENCIFISFSDDCGGIHPEHLDKVFTPFFTTKPIGQGTGLGLGIATRLTERYNGKIWVQNNSKNGATFNLTFPLSLMPVEANNGERLPGNDPFE